MPVPHSPAPTVTRRRSDLSPGRRRLVDLLGHVHFGRVTDLTVRDGEPQFDPPPRVVRTLKISSGRNDPRPEASHPDYLLRDQVVELLAHLDRLGDGVVHRLEVAHGLPLLLEVQGDADAA